MVTEPPPWIDPGNGFRLLVKSARYKALLDYGPMEMDEQEHEVWFDRSRGYSLNMFREDMASKIIWGKSQTIIVWGVDTESGSEWKVTTNEQFKQMIDCRMDVRVLNLVVEVVGKEGYQSMESEVNVAAASNVFCQSSAQGTSGVTTGDVVDSSSSHRHNADFQFEVDWSTLTVIPEDGDMAALVDEDKVFEAMGFKCDDEKVMEAWTNPDPLYVGAAGMEDDLRDAAIPVDDEDIAEPMIDWDRDNPDMLKASYILPWLTSDWQLGNMPL